MTEKEILEYLNRFSYNRERTQLRADRSINGAGIEIRILRETRDADSPEKRTHVNVRELLFATKHVSPESLDSLVQNLVHRFEIHEADEWLRFDGMKLKDPHVDI